jgi:hypothetical protein
MEEKETGRRIVFAVDGTTSCEEGLKWLSRQIARKGASERKGGFVLVPLSLYYCIAE